jgi:hypothetical protein
MTLDDHFAAQRDLAGGANGSGSQIPARLAGASAAPPRRTLNRNRGAAHAKAIAILALAIALAGCGGASTSSGDAQSAATPTNEVMEFVAGQWVPFRAAHYLSEEQWKVVAAYATFGSAVLAVYRVGNVGPLAVVLSPQSQAGAMFRRDLATGVKPEGLYDQATVLGVSIHGCRAKLTLELQYPGGRRLRYVSSWVRPFDRKLSVGAHAQGGARPGRRSSGLKVLARTQNAPWLFVGDNRVGGLTTPCGI